MLTLQDVQEAKERLTPIIHDFPLVKSTTFSQMTGGEIYLKQENQQKTGSFKVRGASNKIMKMAENGPVGTVIASSAGNHAQGVAFAAAKTGAHAIIVMPKTAPIAKASATRGYGAEVVLHGSCYDEAYAKAVELQKEYNATFIHPFNDYDVMAGQGTLAIEMLRDQPDLDMLLIQAGGGGLIAGVATAAKAINPKVKVIGVQAEGAPAIYESFHQPEIHASKNVSTIADGIAVKTPGDLTMELINRYVDQMVVVGDDDIASTIMLLLERSKQVVEPSGAITLAAALAGKVDVKGKKVGVLLSGGEKQFFQFIVDTTLFHRAATIGQKNGWPNFRKFLL